MTSALRDLVSRIKAVVWSRTVQMRRPTDMPRRTDCDSAVDCRVQQRVLMECVDFHV